MRFHRLSIHVAIVLAALLMVRCSGQAGGHGDPQTAGTTPDPTLDAYDTLYASLRELDDIASWTDPLATIGWRLLQGYRYNEECSVIASHTNELHFYVLVSLTLTLEAANDGRLNAFYADDILNLLEVIGLNSVILLDKECSMRIGTPWDELLWIPSPPGATLPTYRPAGCSEERRSAG